jgi:hypothetical protein
MVQTIKEINNHSIELHYEFETLNDFYRECMKIDKKHGDANKYSSFYESTSNDSFRGEDRKTILESKFIYRKALGTLPDINEDLYLGTKKPSYCWSEVDGDEMSMTRAYDQLPFMKQRDHMKGNSKGKFITIHVNIAVSWMVTAENLKYKARTVVALVDYLESIGYRVQVLLEDHTGNAGTLNGKHIDKFYLKIPVKNFNETISSSVLFATIVPWMLRFWIFLFQSAKYKPSDGMGQAIGFRKSDTLGDVYIDSKDCLNEKAFKHKISNLKTLFENEQN